MHVLLVAINAKYIHSNPAVYSLKAYAEARLACKASSGLNISVAEYTINQLPDDILGDIYRRQPDLLCFSCYIWNITQTETILREAKKILPDTQIWLGGPEVSYDAEDVLQRLPEVKGVMKGEGEETFAELVQCVCSSSGKPTDDRLEVIRGISFRKDTIIASNPWREIMDLNKVPFIYEGFDVFDNKIIYYESSRGCPFNCSYCLSSVDKKLRFRDPETVKQELACFLGQMIPQVKFVDRTFNCDHRHAMEIWSYIAAHDNGVTNFHFEISADLLREEEIVLFESMRPGLIQLEIGVQSTNPRTLSEIHRTMDFEKLSENVHRIKAFGNIHQHLDLIAGLPYEDLESFRKSFNDVYALQPDQLQLGFLKVLKGSFMAENSAAYGLKFKDVPPYEVLKTRWLSFSDVLELKDVEEMVEVYYNSAQFANTLPKLQEYFSDAYAMYDELARYYRRKGLFGLKHTRAARYEILLEFVKEMAVDSIGEEFSEVIREIRERLTFDYYLRENAKSRPAFAGEYGLPKEYVRSFYEQEAGELQYLPNYKGYDKNQLRKMTHLEYFKFLGEVVLFDYKERSKLTKEARIISICNCE